MPQVSIRARPIGRAMRPVAETQSDGRSCFNPRPADWPGDAAMTGRVPSPTSVFQSAPGQLAGRCQRDGVREMSVSIRARPIGRAMPSEMPSATLHRFNPRPADWPGDACTARAVSVPTSCFNPRPANWPGDAGCRDASHVARLRFQSAPGRLAGRCCACRDQRCDRRRFQSAPGRLAGRCRGRAPVASGHRLVSIRARPIGRAMRSSPRCCQTRRCIVSIRARPIGRAMRAPPHEPVATDHVFQSAPGRLAGRCVELDALRSRSREFQSAPGQLAGRCAMADCLQRVSIRARPIGRAMRRHDRASFQSAPGRLAGRCSARASG